MVTRTLNFWTRDINTIIKNNFLCFFCCNSSSVLDAVLWLPIQNVVRVKVSCIQLTLTLKMTTARLSKRQSLSRTTVLFRTTFTRTIKHNLLLKWLLGSNLSHLVNSWETLPSFARLANRSSSLCSDDDHLYAIHHSKTPYRYHISTNQWQYVANLSALSNMRESSFCKKAAMVYNAPINVQPVGEGRAWGGDLTSFKNLQSNSLPTGKSFQSNATKFPHPGLHIALSNIPRLDPRKAQ